MLDVAAIPEANVIAEFGPGTGVFTQEIIRRMAPHARLLVFEIDPQFVAVLRAQWSDPRVEIIEASAATIEQQLAQRGLSQVDCIVSGLPFTSLPRPVTHAILAATRRVLRPGGVFVTYQYTPVLRNILRTYFPLTRISRLVLRNLPPALVFECRTTA